MAKTTSPDPLDAAKDDLAQAESALDRLNRFLSTNLPPRFDRTAAQTVVDKYQAAAQAAAIRAHKLKGGQRG